MEEQPTNLTLVAETLDIANEHGMAAEVMWSALIMAAEANEHGQTCLLYTSPSPRDGLLSRMPSSA